MNGRAIMFTGQPQVVEVEHGGNWVPGALLGWRRNAEGSCRVIVRLTAGTEKTAWADLEDVRLPEADVARTPRSGRHAPSELRCPVLARHSSGTESEPVPRGLERGRSNGRERSAMPDVPVNGNSAAEPVQARARGDALTRGQMRVGEESRFVSEGGGRHSAPVPAGRHRAADRGTPSLMSEPDGGVSCRICAFSPGSVRGADPPAWDGRRIDPYMPHGFVSTERRRVTADPVPAVRPEVLR